MVNSLLFVVVAASLLVWLLQEKFARPKMQEKLSDCIASNRNLPAEDFQKVLVPEWSEWLFKGLLAIWGLWVASVLLIKDGDFALVLVMLTLLSAVVSGLDHLLFAAGRVAFVKTESVKTFLDKYIQEQRVLLGDIMGKEFVVAEYAKSFFPVLLVVLILRSFIIEPFQIPSASMVPTLEVGDYILVNKFNYGVRLPVIGTKVFEVGEPERGDVMVFFPPHKDIYFIKRVVGLPGDQVTYKNKLLTVNGKPLEQTLLAELPPLNPVVQLAQEQTGDVEYLIHNDKRVFRGDFSVTVKPGHYFMMGDNRDNSSDSRVWGQVPEGRIVGQAFAIWMHWASFTQLPDFGRVGSIQ